MFTRSTKCSNFIIAFKIKQEILRKKTFRPSAAVKKTNKLSLMRIEEIREYVPSHVFIVGG